MEPTRPKVHAALIVEQFVRAHPTALDEALRAELEVRLETMFRAALSEERASCARACRDRAELWTATSQRASTPPALRDEARARANEATYLADMLEPARPA